ncbi:MAG: SMR family transporter [Planctomycetota bacterium]
MNWAILVVAGLFETAWAIGLKMSDGFTRPLASVFTVIALALSMLLLGIAVRSLPIGTAYAVWVGIGTLGAAILGVAVLGESISVARGCFLALLLVAIVGLKLTTPGPTT